VKFLAEYIMRGRFQAMTVASTLALISLLLPPVSIISSASVALVTLRRGAKEGWVVLLSSCFAAAVLGWLVLGNYQFAIGYSAILWIPVWLISITLRVGRHLSLALEIAVLLGVLAVLGFYFYNAQPAVMWLHVLQKMVAPMLAMPDAPVEQIENSLTTLAHFMTGIVAAGSVTGLLLGLLLGRWWQASLYNPGGFRAEFLGLRNHPRLAFASLVVIAVAFLAKGSVAEIAWNIAIPLFVLYVFTGMAVLHVLLAAKSSKWFLLPILYVFILMIPHALLPVAFIGLGDTWLNLRHRISNQTGA
jgi:hypothetical protein